MANAFDKNVLLGKLDDDDLSRLAPHLERVNLILKSQLNEPDEPVDYTYFPGSGLISILVTARGREEIEVGMVGREGAAGLVLARGVRGSPMRLLVQMDGSAWRIRADVLSEALVQSPGLMQLMLRYQQAFAAQLSSTALAHGSYTVAERLARWLLMSHDRAERDELPHIHEFLAAMLAVRRAGITEATHVLEGFGAIKSQRGLILIRDRATLIELSADSYGTAEAEYDRLVRNWPGAHN